MSHHVQELRRRVPVDAVVAGALAVLLAVHFASFDGGLLPGPVLAFDLGDVAMRVEVVPSLLAVAMVWFAGRARRH